MISFSTVVPATPLCIVDLVAVCTKWDSAVTTSACLQDFVAQIADLCPEYCISSVVMDMLQADSPEAQLIALRSLHLVATSVPQDVAASLDVQASTARKSSTLAVASSTSSSMAGTTTNRRMVRVSAGLQTWAANLQPCFRLNKATRRWGNL